MLLKYLVTIPGVELNWGSGSSSIMGMCYEAFKEAKLPIHGYTSSKYADDIDNLPEADHKIFDTTYDLKKSIFYDADVVVLDDDYSVVTTFARGKQYSYE